MFAPLCSRSLIFMSECGCKAEILRLERLMIRQKMLGKEDTINLRTVVTVRPRAGIMGLWYCSMLWWEEDA